MIKSVTAKQLQLEIVESASEKCCFAQKMGGFSYCERNVKEEIVMKAWPHRYLEIKIQYFSCVFMCYGKWGNWCIKKKNIINGC